LFLVVLCLTFFNQSHNSSDSPSFELLSWSILKSYWFTFHFSVEMRLMIMKVIQLDKDQFSRVRFIYW
jgi:hypothetical protein